MESRLYWEVKTLRDMLDAGVDALNQVEQAEGLSRWGNGYRDSHNHIIKILDRILEEVKE